MEPRSSTTSAAFYFTETGRQQEQSLANPFGMAFVSPYVPPTLADLGPAVASSAKNESIGIYTDVSWTPRSLDALTLNAGGRYSRDTRDAERVGSRSADTDYSRFDPSFTVDYRWTDELHTYARYATAYRAGGFNLLNSNLSPFDPEKLTSYELGLKAQWLDQTPAHEPCGVLADLRGYAARFHRPGYAAGLHTQRRKGHVRRRRR